MKYFVIALFAFFLIGCAGSKQKTPVARAKKPNKTYIRINNTLDTSIHVHLKRPKQRPLYLGRVFSHENKSFQVKGPFKSSQFTLIAKPIVGRTFATTMKSPKGPGKLLAWNVGKRRAHKTSAE